MFKHEAVNDVDWAYISNGTTLRMILSGRTAPLKQILVLRDIKQNLGICLLESGLP
jgi:hypothetical protein